MMHSTIETSSIVSREHGRDCSQGKILHAIASGKIDAVRHGSKWMISDEQIPAIAELFPLRAA
ncbi:MAG: hypothetical protein WCJ64_20965 [Rhodospirillaceae bacterium]